jgi:acyl-CoA hydrolase
VNGYLELALAVAERVVVEEVEWMPRVPGAAIVARADDVVPTHRSHGEPQPGFSSAAGEVDLAIARNVASLIPRDATLALGIGRVNDAVVTQLARRGDVEIVTGVVTDAVRLLHESAGTPDRPVQAMSVVGSDDLLKWSETSGAVTLRPSTEIHEPTWLAAHDRFVSVLGAIDIDTSGNVNSERVDAAMVSGKGGAPDFARGAHESEGGRSIVALSASHRRARTRLVDLLEDPTVPAQWIDAVATERGVAVLEGLSSAQRRWALGEIF